MPTKTISRRDFLKATGITAAAVGLTVCGVCAAAPEPPPIDLLSNSFGEKNTNACVLIAYASATGSTVSVATEIGKTLAAGISVDVRPNPRKSTG